MFHKGILKVSVYLMAAIILISSPSQMLHAAAAKPQKKVQSKSVKSEKVSSKIMMEGIQVATFARKFVGNPYRYGGTSLTRGADCSGFVMSIYKYFGYSIPRTSRTQSVAAGKRVSLKYLKAGDLVFYSRSGRINHVAMYIGNNRVVHASSRKTGIKVSHINYRKPIKARRIIA